MFLFIQIPVLVFMMVTGAAIGMFIGSIFDRGRRGDGDVRQDLPSTLGMIIGTAVGLIIYSKFEMHW